MCVCSCYAHSKSLLACNEGKGESWGDFGIAAAWASRQSWNEATSLRLSKGMLLWDSLRVTGGQGARGMILAWSLGFAWRPDDSVNHVGQLDCE